MQANLKMTEGHLVMTALGDLRWEPWSMRKEGKGSKREELQKGQKETFQEWGIGSLS